MLQRAHRGRALRDLVRSDRVHRSLYTDPEIFELEMERIFRKAWLYVGHTSQVPEPGDYLTTELAGEPVVMVRSRESGDVRVLFNRCGHRGALVCRESAGNATLLRCCYHGWAFDTEGRLHSVPLREGYDPALLRQPELGMVAVPRVAAHRGFVFASLSPEGPDLKSFLGPAAQRIDEVVNLSPTGEVEVRGGVHKYRFRGNWKAQLENLTDLYHPPFSHESTTAEGRQFQRQGAEQGAQLMDEHGRPISFWDETGVWASPRGHGWAGRMPNAGERTDPAFLEYRAMLVERHGEQRTREILDVPWHNTVIYPGLCIQSMAQHVRVIKPVSVELTEVHVAPILLTGAPAALNQGVIRYLNITHAAASLIQTDDLEAFQRIRQGLRSTGAEWVILGRYAGRDERCDEGWRGSGTSELELRNQYAAWLEYMQGGEA